MDAVKHTPKPSWPPVKPAPKIGTTPPKTPTIKNPNIRVPTPAGKHAR